MKKSGSGGVGIKYGSDKTPPATKSTQPATKKSPTTRGPTKKY